MIDTDDLRTAADFAFDDYYGTKALCQAAADEIDRLREALNVSVAREDRSYNVYT